jgi:hypothetical protein
MPRAILGHDCHRFVSPGLELGKRTRRVICLQTAIVSRVGKIQGVQKFSVHLMITVHKTRKIILNNLNQ